LPPDEYTVDGGDESIEGRRRAIETTRSRPLVVGIGELLWDDVPAGRRMGGAPGNFALHAAALGARAAVVSAVGDDPDGEEIVGHYRAAGVDTSAVAVNPVHPTGAARVALDRRVAHGAEHTPPAAAKPANTRG